MTDSCKPSNVVSLTKARQARPEKLPNGKPLPPFSTYDPPAPYMVKPCQVIALPARVEPENPV
jgi:hypothetical protein